MTRNREPVNRSDALGAVGLERGQGRRWAGRRRGCRRGHWCPSGADVLGGRSPSLDGPASRARRTPPSPLAAEGYQRHLSARLAPYLHEAVPQLGTRRRPWPPQRLKPPVAAERLAEPRSGLQRAWPAPFARRPAHTACEYSLRSRVDPGRRLSTWARHLRPSRTATAFMACFA